MSKDSFKLEEISIEEYNKTHQDMENDFFDNSNIEEIKDNLSTMLSEIPTLDNYLLVETTQHSLSVWNPYIKCPLGSKSNLLGKIPLLNNYFLSLNFQPNIENIFRLKQYEANTRYDYSFISKTLNLIVVSNRAGDIQIYELKLFVV